MKTSGQDYDAVIVGARCAGSSTALLLARAGRRVLLVDRVHPSQDTLSTHALMRGGVLQLQRWGVLERIIAAGTPPVSGTTFHYGEQTETVEHATLYAPRRTVLDTTLLAAAQQAGVELRLGVDVTGLSHEGTGRVSGVTGRVRGGGRLRVHAPITIGADGTRSTVAQLAGAATVRTGHAAGAIIYGYWPSRPAPHFELFYRPGASAGIIPTNDGEVCVWAGISAQRFAAERHRGHRALFDDILASTAPPALDIVQGATATAPLRGFPGRPGHLRRATGPGWALVGDAGYFKDPLTAHGITDALRDAELLARAVGAGGAAALFEYERLRDRLSLPLLEVTESIAGYAWDTEEIRALVLAESHAMKPEVAALRALDAPPSRAA
jgi:flavin-dependent dehydrogenase